MADEQREILIKLNLEAGDQFDLTGFLNGARETDAFFDALQGNIDASNQAIGDWSDTAVADFLKVEDAARRLSEINVVAEMFTGADQAHNTISEISGALDAITESDPSIQIQVDDGLQDAIVEIGDGFDGLHDKAESALTFETSSDLAGPIVDQVGLIENALTGLDETLDESIGSDVELNITGNLGDAIPLIEGVQDDVTSLKDSAADGIDISIDADVTTNLDGIQDQEIEVSVTGNLDEAAPLIEGLESDVSNLRDSVSDGLTFTVNAEFDGDLSGIQDYSTSFDGANDSLLVFQDSLDNIHLGDDLSESLVTVHDSLDNLQANDVSISIGATVDGDFSEVTGEFNSAVTELTEDAADGASNIQTVFNSIGLGDFGEKFQEAFEQGDAEVAIFNALLGETADMIEGTGNALSSLDESVAVIDAIGEAFVQATGNSDAGVEFVEGLKNSLDELPAVAESVSESLAEVGTDTSGVEQYRETVAQEFENIKTIAASAGLDEGLLAIFENAPIETITELNDKLADSAERIREMGAAGLEFEEVDSIIRSLSDAFGEVAESAEVSEAIYDDMKDELVELYDKTRIAAEESADAQIKSAQETADEGRAAQQELQASIADTSITLAQAVGSAGQFGVALEFVGAKHEDIEQLASAFAEMSGTFLAIGSGATTLAQADSFIGQLIDTADDLPDILEASGRGATFMESAMLTAAPVATKLQAALGPLAIAIAAAGVAYAAYQGLDALIEDEEEARIRRQQESLDAYRESMVRLTEEVKVQQQEQRILTDIMDSQFDAQLALNGGEASAEQILEDFRASDGQNKEVLISNMNELFNELQTENAEEINEIQNLRERIPELESELDSVRRIQENPYSIPSEKRTAANRESDILNELPQAIAKVTAAENHGIVGALDGLNQNFENVGDLAEAVRRLGGEDANRGLKILEENQRAIQAQINESIGKTDSQKRRLDGEERDAEKDLGDAQDAFAKEKDLANLINVLDDEQGIEDQLETYLANFEANGTRENQVDTVAFLNKNGLITSEQSTELSKPGLENFSDEVRDDFNNNRYFDPGEQRDIQKDIEEANDRLQKTKEVRQRLNSLNAEFLQELEAQQADVIAIKEALQKNRNDRGV